MKYDEAFKKLFRYTGKYRRFYILNYLFSFSITKMYNKRESIG